MSDNHHPDSADESKDDEVREMSRDELDAARIEEWHAAAERATTKDQRDVLLDRVKDLRMELDAAEEQYAKACAEAATVWGWTAIAQEQSVSAKQLHTWHRNLTPDLPDLSKIPEQEMRRQQRRADEIRRQLETEDRLRAQLAAHEEKMNRIQEALHGK